MLTTSITNTNITILFANPINTYSIPLNELSNIIIDAFNSKPIINQFPDFLAVIIPQKNLSITVDLKRAIVTDQTATDYVGRKLEPLVELVILLTKKCIKQEIRAYGFNFSALTEKKNSREDSGKYLNTLFLSNNEKLIKKLSAKSIFASGHRLLFFGDDKKRYDLRIEPELGPELSPTNKFVINENVHMEKTFLPQRAELIKDISKEYESLNLRLNQLLT